MKEEQIITKEHQRKTYRKHCYSWVKTVKNIWKHLKTSKQKQTNKEQTETIRTRTILRTTNNVYKTIEKTTKQQTIMNGKTKKTTLT